MTHPSKVVRTLYLVGLEHGWIIFHFIYGMSSFPLTNSYFSEGWLNHQPVSLVFLSILVGFLKKLIWLETQIGCIGWYIILCNTSHPKRRYPPVIDMEDSLYFLVSAFPRAAIFLQTHLRIFTSSSPLSLGISPLNPISL